MAEAPRDANRVTTMLGVSSSDLLTPTKAAIDPITNRLLVTEGSASTIADATKVEDTAHVSGDRGMAIWAVRNDSQGNFGTSLMDYTPIAVDAQGNVLTTGNRAHDAIDSGAPAKIGGRASSAPVTAVAVNDRVDGFFDLQGRLVTAQKAATATLSNIDGSTTSGTLLAANVARLGATILNDSTAVLYVKFGTTAASATSFTAKLFQDDYYEVPYGYTGMITGIWASATGAARVTEVT